MTHGTAAWFDNVSKRFLWFHRILGLVFKCRHKCRGQGQVTVEESPWQSALLGGLWSSSGSCKNVEVCLGSLSCCSMNPLSTKVQNAGYSTSLKKELMLLFSGQVYTDSRNADTDIRMGVSRVNLFFQTLFPSLRSGLETAASPLRALLDRLLLTVPLLVEVFWSSLFSKLFICWWCGFYHNANHV